MAGTDGPISIETANAHSPNMPLGSGDKAAMMSRSNSEEALNVGPGSGGGGGGEGFEQNDDGECVRV